MGCRHIRGGCGVRAVSIARSRRHPCRGNVGRAMTGPLREAHPGRLSPTPMDAIAALSDDTPILLLPLRLETRFKLLGTAPNVTRELWVRVFPDECAVDAFEPLLSDAEITRAQQFWKEFGLAAGDESLERAAWRRLATANGAGRAAWIVQEYRPSNLDAMRAAPSTTPPDFPVAGAITTRATGWTQQAATRVMPDRLVLLGYS